MKSKIEVKRAIVKLQTLLEIPESPPTYIEAVKGEIRTLRWVLGEQIPDVYFCTTCNSSHENKVCPKCGGANVVKEKEPVL